MRQCGSGVRVGETETVVLVSGQFPFVKLETIEFHAG